MASSTGEPSASDSSRTRHGSCLCRKVTYTISGPPLKTVLCHCNNCQKASGSAFQANASYKRDRFKILSGEDSIQKYIDNNTNSGSTIHRRFCKSCGSTLFATNETNPANSDTLVVMTGCLDGEKDFVPELEFFCKNRYHSMPEVQETKKFETMPH